MDLLRNRWDINSWVYEPRRDIRLQLRMIRDMDRDIFDWYKLTVSHSQNSKRIRAGNLEDFQ